MLNLSSVPKYELHCHLDGSLSPAMMEQHLHRKLSESEISVGMDCPSLTEYLTKFDVPLECLQTAENLAAHACAFMKQLARDHVEYVEVRFAPMLSCREGLSCAEVLKHVQHGLELGREATGIRYQIISCAMRNFSPDNNMQMLDAIEPLIGHGVCALDLAGDESRYPNELFQELFQEAAHRRIPFVIHSGETGDVKNVRTALEYGAARIGHGLALAKDPDLMQEIARRGIGIEMCPTSNLQTKAVPSLREYPLDTFLNAGIKVCINTDNRTVSRTTLTEELEQIYQLYRDEGMIRQLVKNAEELCLLHNI